MHPGLGHEFPTRVGERLLYLVVRVTDAGEVVAMLMLVGVFAWRAALLW
jgi:hypothetical protein